MILIVAVLVESNFDSVKQSILYQFGKRTNPFFAGELRDTISHNTYAKATTRPFGSGRSKITFME